ncbi:MAG: hypothetical protein AB1689_13030, partial [Thermodesulfobacteriota bacterium]
MRERFRPRLAALALVSVLALVALSCSDATDPAEPPLDVATLTAPGPYAVGERALELVDTSRPTDPNGDFPGAPGRRLPTRVWYPAAAAGTGAAPAPD